MAYALPITANSNTKEHTTMHYDDYADSIGDGYTNEYQRAYAHRWSETPTGPDAATREASAAGKFVLVHCMAQYCRITDATLGDLKVFHSAYDCEMDALAALAQFNTIGDSYHNDDWYTVLYPADFTLTRLAEGVTYYADDDIPF
jgi:hypothetical protein